MRVLDKAKPKAKAKAAVATAATSFFIANPLWSALLIGAALGIYWGMRTRGWTNTDTDTEADLN
jgi:hypothetical protein